MNHPAILDVVLQRITMTDMIPSPLVAVSTVVAMFCGFIAAQGGDDATARTGMWIGLAAAITAVGSVAAPPLKMWAENHRAVEIAKYERHDLAGKLQLALLKIETQDQRIEELNVSNAHLRQTIDRLMKHSPVDPPVPPLGPDPGVSRGPDYST